MADSAGGPSDPSASSGSSRASSRDEARRRRASASDSLEPPRAPESAYLAALKMLARRELSVEAVRTRLQDRDYPQDEIAAAVDHLLQNGALDDGRVARAHARTAAKVKGRGRLRVVRELHAMGIDRQVASEAVAEVFGELDERSLIARALDKKLRGRPKVTGTAERARLYQYLMRQGFSPAAVSHALRRLGGRAGNVDD